MWLGVKGIISCRRNQHDQIFLVALLGYLVVGTGSFLFHSTLKCKYSPKGVWSLPRACRCLSVGRIGVVISSS
jgi:hypothetical protein